MATTCTFPTTLDTELEDAVSGASVSVSSWNILMDEVHQLQTKIGVDDSTVNTSFDWKLTSAGSYDPGHRHTAIYNSAGTNVICANSDYLHFSSETFSMEGKEFRFPTASAVSGCTLENIFGVTNGWNFLEARRLVVKVADESITSSTTLQDDDALVISVEANACYHMRMGILYEASTAGDMKCRFTGPADINIRWSNMNRLFAAVADPTAGEPYTITDVVLRGGAGSGVAVAFQVMATISVGSTAGNVTLQWAQNASNATATKILKGSFMWVTRVS